MTTDTATAGPTPAEIQSALIDRLGKLVNQETRSAAHRLPDFNPNAEAMRELLWELRALFDFVRLGADITAHFVRHFQDAYSAACEAMTDDFRFALRPDTGDKLLYFQWGDDGDIEGETHCDILLDGLGGHWHFQMAFDSDSDGYQKAILAGKPYKLKPKAVVKAWPEILKRLGDESEEKQNVTEAVDDDRWTGEKSPGEWCKIIGKSQSTLKRYIEDGTLVVKKNGTRRWRIRRDTLEQLTAK